MREPPYREPYMDPALRSGRLGVPAIEVHRSADLVVRREDRVDFGRDETGRRFHYIYRFATYEIVALGRELGARRYADSWAEVSIFVGSLPPEGGIPYQDDAFALAARYFFGLADVETVTAFVESGYQPVDPARLPRG
jgi:hypothetical protein